MDNRAKILVLLLLAVAVPATAQSLFSFGASAPTCLSIGNATWRIGAGAGRSDVTVRFDPAAETPDLRIQMADSPDTADFVFVDDGETAPGCHGAANFKTVRIDATARKPDLTIGFASSAAPADYRIFVRSRWLAPETAAAMFAAAQMPARMLATRAAVAR